MDAIYSALMRRRLWALQTLSMQSAQCMALLHYLPANTIATSLNDVSWNIVEKKCNSLVIYKFKKTKRFFPLLRQTDRGSDSAPLEAL